MGNDLAEMSKTKSLVEGTSGEAHAQVPSICKEREMGWLCSYPAQGGVHTESLS